MQRRDFQSSQLYKKISPWIVQESFNTISATINIVVEATVCRKYHFLFKELKVLPNIVELYLYLLAMPQTPVTRLRGVGGALHILNQFGIEIFLDITGPSLQHWIRVMLSLMNSISLSVRSIAVDFVVSLLGSSYDMHGNIDVILNVFLTVLPEVVAREVATYAVNGHISCFDDVFKSVWPIRRAIADIEDSNPLDDDRIDPQLAPIVSSFCRASQAIIDGVLIEMRLGGNSITVVGTVIQGLVSEDSLFDADEESLFEAVSNFLPEIAPIQRLRWLFTLKSLHEEKEQWVEAAETLLMCAHTIIESIPYINHAWRPKRFNLWSDERQSTGFGVMGEEVVYHYKENNEVMEFAAAFLDPKSLLGVQWSLVSGGNISIMCCLLELIVTEIVRLYCSDDNLCGLAYNRLESLLNAALAASRNYSSRFCSKSNISGIAASTYTQCVQEHSSLQNVVALISRQVGKLAEFLHPQNVASSEEHTRLTHIGLGGDQYFGNSLVFVVMCLSGVKPSRFTESTSLPAFLEWDTPCICRVPVTSELQNNGILNSSKSICEAFAHRYILALKKECGETNVVLKTDNSVSSNRADTTLEVFLAEIVIMNGVNGRLISPHMSFKQVVYKTNNALVENTIAQAFPCVLSRQRPIMTTRILTSHSNDFHQSK